MEPVKFLSLLNLRGETLLTSDTKGAAWERKDTADKGKAIEKT
jgi:hypothetical protein